MNKKGFTLIEMLFVIALIGIIATIIFPSILDAISESKNEKYYNLEKIIKENMKLYNSDNQKDLWEGDANCFVDLQLSDLHSVNPNLDLDNCQLATGKVQIQYNSNKFKYLVKLQCGDLEKQEFEYETKFESGESFKTGCE